MSHRDEDNPYRAPGVPKTRAPADWSPHGWRIAYAGIVNGMFDLFTIPAGGGDPVPVIHDAALDWNPRWAPDGRHLYFISDRGGRTNLWRVEIDEATGRVAGGPQAIITGAASISSPTISRDGHRIAYTQTNIDANVFKRWRATAKLRFH